MPPSWQSSRRAEYHTSCARGMRRPASPLGSRSSSRTSGPRLTPKRSRRCSRRCRSAWTKEAAPAARAAAPEVVPPRSSLVLATRSPRRGRQAVPSLAAAPLQDPAVAALLAAVAAASIPPWLPSSQGPSQWPTSPSPRRSYSCAWPRARASRPSSTWTTQLLPSGNSSQRRWARTRSRRPPSTSWWQAFRPSPSQTSRSP
mmetsp:Transcript_1515/g.4148  ORF Transcript_1515/g.4148 Transcript_1515/m.4148 type:complete len:201 (-) Transcript_1515:196-798(-)